MQLSEYKRIVDNKTFLLDLKRYRSNLSRTRLYSITILQTRCWLYFIILDFPLHLLANDNAIVLTVYESIVRKECLGEY